MKNKFNYHKASVLMNTIRRMDEEGRLLEPSSDLGRELLASMDSSITGRYCMGTFTGKTNANDGKVLLVNVHVSHYTVKLVRGWPKLFEHTFMLDHVWVDPIVFKTPVDPPYPAGLEDIDPSLDTDKDCKEYFTKVFPKVRDIELKEGEEIFFLGDFEEYERMDGSVSYGFVPLHDLAALSIQACCLLKAAEDRLIKRQVTKLLIGFVIGNLIFCIRKKNFYYFNGGLLWLIEYEADMHMGDCSTRKRKKKRIPKRSRGFGEKTLPRGEVRIDTKAMC